MKKSLRNGLITLFTFSTSAFASVGVSHGEGSLLLSLFIGFFALLIVCQVLPACLLFAGVAKAFLGQGDDVVSRSDN